MDGHGQAVRQEDVGAGQGHASFDQIFQLSDITREIVFFKQIDGVGGKFGDFLTPAPVNIFPESAGPGAAGPLFFPATAGS